MLRSGGRAGQPVPAVDAELDYPSLLNRALPEDIRVLGWTDVPADFSARSARPLCCGAIQLLLLLLLLWLPAARSAAAAWLNGWQGFRLRLAGQVVFALCLTMQL